MKFCTLPLPLGLALLLSTFSSAGPAAPTAASTGVPLSGSDQLRKYVEEFNRQDDELYKQDIPNSKACGFLNANIPLFDAPDEDFVRTYYFRWWVFRKHVRTTPDGRVVTEFLPDVPWAGKYNTISCALGHHLMEGRWLRDRGIMREDARFWLEKTDGAQLRKYSNWLGEGLWELHEVDPDPAFLAGLLPAMVANYQGWEKEHRCPDGLFYQTDNADGMEVSLGGSGRRPTLNSYLYGEARVIARIARMAGKPGLAEEYDAKAGQLRNLVMAKLWDADAGFFKVLPGREGDGKAGVRELLGFSPWLTGLVGPGESYTRAWRQLVDPKGFLAPYGLTTAEQRDPRFTVSQQGHECQWNGPSWPYLTSATLKALGNALQAGRTLPVTRSDYFKLLGNYTRSQCLKTEDGKVLPWIDENMDPFHGTWLARKLLIERQSPIKERGKDYNHSSYCDLVISGLIGIQPREDDTLVIDPLLPAGRWRYFCLSNLSYHNRELTVVWDETGKHYGRGQGLRLLVDGKVITSRADLGKLAATLPPK